MEAGGGQVGPPGGLLYPGAGAGHPRGAQHAAVGSKRVGHLSDGCRIPGGEGLSDPIHLSGRAGLEETYQLADERGVAETLPGPAQLGNNGRIENLFNRHGASLRLGGDGAFTGRPNCRRLLRDRLDCSGREQGGELGGHDGGDGAKLRRGFDALA